MSRNSSLIDTELCVWFQLWKNAYRASTTKWYFALMHIWTSMAALISNLPSIIFSPLSTWCTRIEHIQLLTVHKESRALSFEMRFLIIVAVVGFASTNTTPSLTESVTDIAEDIYEYENTVRFGERKSTILLLT